RTGILCLGNDGLDLLQKIASLYQSFRRRVGIATPFLSGQQPDIPEGHPPEASTAVGKIANPVVLETIGRPQVDVVGATRIVCDRYPCRPAPLASVKPTLPDCFLAGVEAAEQPDSQLRNRGRLMGQEIYPHQLLGRST